MKLNVHPLPATAAVTAVGALLSAGSLHLPDLAVVPGAVAAAYGLSRLSLTMPWAAQVLQGLYLYVVITLSVTVLTNVEAVLGIGVGGLGLTSGLIRPFVHPVAFFGIVLSTAVAVIALATLPVLVKTWFKGRGEDPHASTLEDDLMPSMHGKSKIGHLLPDPKAEGTMKRAYLAHVWVRDWVGRKVIRALFLPVAAVGVLVFGGQGTGKGATALANFLYGHFGPDHTGPDGHGGGHSGPKVVVSNAPDFLDALPFRVNLVQQMIIAARLNEPTNFVGTEAELEAERVRLLEKLTVERISIIDPSGVLKRDDPRYAPYFKGWDPLDEVHDFTSAGTVAELLAEAQPIEATNADYFTQATASLLAPLLLAAKRGDHTFAKIDYWLGEFTVNADRRRNAKTQVDTLLAKPSPHPADVEAKRKFDAAFQRLMNNSGGGETQAVLGTFQLICKAWSDPEVAAFMAESQKPGRTYDVRRAMRSAYSTTWVLASNDSSRLKTTRPVIVSFMDRLVQGARNHSWETGLKINLQVLCDEYQTIVPFGTKGGSYLDQLRQYGMFFMFLTQTWKGLIDAVGVGEANRIREGVQATLHFGTVDIDLAEEIIKTAGTKRYKKASTTTRSGQVTSDSRSHSFETVDKVTHERLKTLPTDQILVQLSGTSGSIDGGIPPMIGRQNRVALSDIEFADGWYLDPVLNARLKTGSAQGVQATTIPRNYMRKIVKWRRRLEEQWPGLFGKTA